MVVEMSKTGNTYSAQIPNTSTSGDVEYYIDLRKHPISETFEFEEGFVMGGTDDNDEPYGKCTFECNFIYGLRYIHQLQHAIKLGKNDKEIKL